MIRPLFVVLSLVALAGSGLAHGLLTGRWTPVEDHSQFARQIDQVPHVIGDYECKDREMDVKPEERVSAHMLRRYVHRATGATISVWVARGAPGPLSMHTPDYCYRASGYEMSGSPAKYALAAGEAGDRAEFWTAEFSKAKPTGTEHIRVFWAWSTGGAWEAPESARVAYARAPRLYKLYFVCSADGRRLDDGDPTVEFMKRFLPELGRFMQ